MGKITISGTEDGGFEVRGDEPKNKRPYIPIMTLREVMEAEESTPITVREVNDAVAAVFGPANEEDGGQDGPHVHGCICADCSGAELTSEND